MAQGSPPPASGSWNSSTLQEKTQEAPERVRGPQPGPGQPCRPRLCFRCPVPRAGGAVSSSLGLARPFCSPCSAPGLPRGLTHRPEGRLPKRARLPGAAPCVPNPVSILRLTTPPRPPRLQTRLGSPPRVTNIGPWAQRAGGAQAMLREQDQSQPPAPPGPLAAVRVRESGPGRQPRASSAA